MLVIYETGARVLGLSENHCRRGKFQELEFISIINQAKFRLYVILCQLVGDMWSMWNIGSLFRICNFPAIMTAWFSLTLITT